MRKTLLINKKDLKGKIVGNWYHKLPSFLKGSLTSRRRKFLCKVTSRTKRNWRKLIGKETVPMFEIANNPSVKLNDIKKRRFYIEKEK